PSHERCQHFFTHGHQGQQKGKGKSELPWRIEVTLTPPFETGEPELFHQCITLRPPHSRGWGTIGIQVFTFVISFLTATAAAFAAQYGTIPDLTVPSTLLTAFLFGFSLDQIRDRTTAQSSNEATN